MIKLYEYHTIERYKNPKWLLNARLKYSASAVMEMLAISDPDEISLSLHRAFQACSMLHMPVYIHFQRIFCCDGSDLVIDWKISSLACYLIIINCDPKYEGVAKAQLWYAMNHVNSDLAKHF